MAHQEFNHSRALPAPAERGLKVIAPLAKIVSGSTTTLIGTRNPKVRVKGPRVMAAVVVKARGKAKVNPPLQVVLDIPHDMVQMGALAPQGHQQTKTAQGN